MNTTATTAPAPTTPALVTGNLARRTEKAPCRCSDGCGGLTWVFFSQGHDARMVTRLADEVGAAGYTEAALTAAIRELHQRGGETPLADKLRAVVAKAHAKDEARKAGAERRAAEKAQRELAKAERAAYAEQTRRNQAEAREAKAAAKLAAKAAAAPVVTETPAKARVGRWEYNGTLRQVGDAAPVFVFTNRQGKPGQETTRYTVIGQ